MSSVSLYQIQKQCQSHITNITVLLLLLYAVTKKKRLKLNENYWQKKPT